MCIPGNFLFHKQQIRVTLCAALLAATLLPQGCTPRASDSRPEATGSVEAQRWNDTARFLSGMKGRADGPFRALEDTAAWKAYAAEFDTNWNQLQAEQLRPVHAFQKRELASLHAAGQYVFYPFSGPDILYLTGFFPEGKVMVMAGLERADTGTVAVAGEDLGLLDEDDLARFRGRNVGIVFQSFHLIPTMTALENVAVPLELAGVADAQERARHELAGVGLGERLHHYPAQLSGGEQQRVAVARALAPNPAILVADEPTGNLDEETGQQIIDLLFAGHANRGTTLVLVTHDTALAARCGRVVRLRSGHIDGAGAP